jgi:hypothetical protein
MHRPFKWEENEVCEPLKKKKAKPWGIDARYIGPITLIHREWQSYKLYETEKSRDAALNTLRSKNRRPSNSFEYRKSLDTQT